MKKLGLPVLLVLLGVLVVYFLGRYDTGVNAAEAAHQSRVEEALRTAKPHHARVDSLRDAAVTSARLSARLVASDAQRRVLTDSLRDAVAVLPVDAMVPRDVVLQLAAQYEDRIDSLHRAVILLAAARMDDSTRADVAELRVRNLEAVLQQDPGRCKLLFVLPCVSRMTAFFGGVLLGAGGMALANR